MGIDEEYIHYQECLTSLNSAWCILSELENSSENKILRSAAYRMALIEYCKPYKKSYGRGKSRHYLEETLSSENDKLLHKKIIDLRDTVLAHSDINRKESKVYFTEANDKPLLLISSSNDAQWPSVNEIKKLIETTLDQLYKKQKEYEDKYNQKPY